MEKCLDSGKDCADFSFLLESEDAIILIKEKHQ